MFTLIRFLILVIVMFIIYKRGYKDGQIAIANKVKSLAEIFNKVKGKNENGKM